MSKPEYAKKDRLSSNVQIGYGIREFEIPKTKVMKHDDGYRSEFIQNNGLRGIFYVAKDLEKLTEQYISIVSDVIKRDLLESKKIMVHDKNASPIEIAIKLNKDNTKIFAKGKAKYLDLGAYCMVE